VKKILAIVFSNIIPVLITIIGLSVLIFFLVHALPGDPAQAILGERATAEALEVMRAQMGLNDPLWQQFLRFIKNVFIDFDLGRSIKTQELVSTEIMQKFPATFELTVVALFISLILGSIAGVLAAVYRSTFIDYGSMSLALMGVSMPIFWLALLLIWAFAVKFPIFPVSGRIDPIIDFAPITHVYVLDALITGNWHALGDILKHLFLPSLALATIPTAVIARFTRSAMLETLGQDFIRTAHAKGLSKIWVIVKHALSNSLIPVLTVAGLQFGVLLGGAIITETIFSWPGVGRWLLESVTARDYPAVQGAVLTIGILFIVVNLSTDLMYSVVDPRMRKVKN